MSVISIKQLDGDCLLGLWQINEEYDELISELNLSDDELATLETFKNYYRKLEWLSVRRLLIEMTSNKNSRITYNDAHKPFLEDNSYNISISHSYQLTSILMSKTRKVGIDLEYMSHKIKSLEHKFVNDKEVITRSNKENHKYHLYIHWCAKETLYKICDKQDINFKHNITIQPFEPKEEGEVFGFVDNDFRHEKFLINFFKWENYIIVWTCK
jgi:4'-phosphopantetheinyl transferase